MSSKTTAFLELVAKTSPAEAIKKVDLTPAELSQLLKIIIDSRKIKEANDYN